MTVLLIDHHGARFFESAGSGTALEEGEHLKPKDPHGFERHLEHRKEADYRGQRVPEADEFYERVAQRLTSGSSIVLVGDGTGKSSAMRYFLEYLKHKHKAIADRVRGTEDANLSGITLGQIEEIAARH
jgi:stalled ribosome rescue protein Dom34